METFPLAASFPLPSAFYVALRVVRMGVPYFRWTIPLFAFRGRSAEDERIKMFLSLPKVTNGRNINIDDDKNNSLSKKVLYRRCICLDLRNCFQVPVTIRYRSSLLLGCDFIITTHTKYNIPFNKPPAIRCCIENHHFSKWCNELETLNTIIERFFLSFFLFLPIHSFCSITNYFPRHLEQKRRL